MPGQQAEAKSRLSVVQLLPALQSGGVERGTLEIAEALIQQGHRAIVISAHGALVEELIALGGEHIDWPIGVKSLTTLRWIKPLRALFERGDIDIVHARSRLPAWLTYRAWSKADPDKRPRFVTTVHGLHSVNRYSAIMTRSEAVIAVSNTVRDYILQNYNTDPQRIQLIYRGVDPAAFPYAYQPSQQWLHDWYQQYPQLQNPEQKILTLPGRLSRRKGHEDFLQLIVYLKQRGLAVHGLIVGADDKRQRYRDELKQQADKLGIAQDITFTGQRQDIRDIYAVSDLVFSLSAKPESFGRTVLEALSLGTPVIGYDHGGVAEILSALFPEGKVALGNLDELTGKTEMLLQQRAVVSDIKAFPKQRMLQQTLSLYQELAGQRQRQLYK